MIIKDLMILIISCRVFRVIIHVWGLVILLPSWTTNESVLKYSSWEKYTRLTLRSCDMKQNHPTASCSLKSIFVDKDWQKTEIALSLPRNSQEKWCNLLNIWCRVWLWVVARICKFLRKSKEKRPEEGPFSANKSYCILSQSHRINCIRWPDDDEIDPYMDGWAFEDHKHKTSLRQFELMCSQE